MTKTPPEHSQISQEGSSKSKLIPTPEQQSIIRSKAKIKQIVAVAGAAKTTTEVLCAARLIERGVDPGRILFLTALKSAQAVLVAKLPAGVECLTFHSLGLKLAKGAGLAGRRVKRLSVKGQLTFLMRALKIEARRWDDVDPRSSKFLRALRKSAAKKPGATVIVSGKKPRRKAANKVKPLLKFVELMEAVGPEFADTAREPGSKYKMHAPHLMCIKAVARRFIKLKRKAGALDYGDMVRLGLAAIANGAVLDYDHVFVDEWQDCYPSQVQMLVALAPSLKSLTVVGDPLQAIMGFKGARFIDLAPLIERTKSYPLALSHRLNKYTAALATALGRLVIPGMPPIEAKQPGGHRPRLVQCMERGEHDRAVLATIEHLIATGVPPHRIAVLGRVKAQLREAEALFRAAGLEPKPLYRTPQSEHVQAVLKLIEGIQGQTGKLGREEIRKAMRKLAGGRDMPQSTIDDHVRDLLKVNGAKSFASHYRVCANAYISAKGNGLSKDAVAEVNSWAAPSQCHTDVDAMRRTIAAHAQQDKMITSHVHKAKGHEWDYVLVLHAVEGSWPFFRAKTKSALAEELHALYVAVTRAEKGVFLFEGRYKNARSRKTFSEPSSLLEQKQVRATLKIVAASEAIAHPEL